MNKNILIDLLRIVQRDMKRRIEQGTWEGDRDLWSKWHDYITDMIKTILEGGITEKPKNIIFYATSNRRHIISRSMSENEESTSIMPHETVEENISLSDRFGLWLGFYQCSQAEYLAMIEDYIKAYKINTDIEKAKKSALEWSITRGARSGRVAWQFIQDLAGKLEKKI